MQRINRLNSRTVATLNRPGRHADGAGLYLSIANDGATQRRRWVLLFRWNGKTREMGLGSASTISLADARGEARKWRAEIRAGRDPFVLRKAHRQSQASIRTFAEVAEAYSAAKSQEWRSSKQRKQWLAPLVRHAKRLLAMSVQDIDTEDVLAVLRPIWTEKPETAARVRTRIEVVLDAARAQSLIEPTKANPARWKGHLAHLLPKQKKLTRGHHAALPYEAVPDFVKRLRQRRAVAALALEFLILTASRTGEVIGATWEEFDVAARVWTIPADRMKAERQHRVPLAPRAIAILEKARQLRQGDLVFPRKVAGDQRLSNMALAMCLRRVHGEGVTVHGFRSSFRDWVGDATNFPRELAETALAHIAGDATERAYRRGDALERRRRLMEAWANYLEPRKQGKMTLAGSYDENFSEA